MTAAGAAAGCEDGSFFIGGVGVDSGSAGVVTGFPVFDSCVSGSDSASDIGSSIVSAKISRVESPEAMWTLQ